MISTEGEYDIDARDNVVSSIAQNAIVPKSQASSAVQHWLGRRCFRRQVTAYRETDDERRRRKIVESIRDSAWASLAGGGHDPRLNACIAERAFDLAATQRGRLSLEKLYKENIDSALQYAMEAQQTISDFTAQLKLELDATCAIGTTGHVSALTRLREHLKPAIDPASGLKHGDAERMWTDDDDEQLDELVLSEAERRGWLALAADSDVSTGEKRHKMAWKLLSEHEGYRLYLQELVRLEQITPLLETSAPIASEG